MFRAIFPSIRALLHALWYIHLKIIKLLALFIGKPSQIAYVQQAVNCRECKYCTAGGEQKQEGEDGSSWRDHDARMNDEVVVVEVKDLKKTRKSVGNQMNGCR